MESFIKIGPLVWAVEMTQTDTQTHRETHGHTNTQTDTLGSIATYSVKTTEYKNILSRSYLSVSRAIPAIRRPARRVALST